MPSLKKKKKSSDIRLECPKAWFKLSPEDRTSKAITMSVFTAPGALCWHVEMGTEEGMKDERFPHTHYSKGKDTIRAVPVWVNTAGVFFEQSGPFDSHLNKIQIEGAEHTIHLPAKEEEKKKPPLCILMHTCGKMGWVRIAERCVPYWANSGILVPLRLPPAPSPPYLYIPTTPPKDTWKQDSHSWEQCNEKWVLPSVEWLVTSASGPLGKRGRERKEMSANYGELEAKHQCGLSLSPAPLKNDGVPS